MKLAVQVTHFGRYRLGFTRVADIQSSLSRVLCNFRPSITLILLLFQFYLIINCSISSARISIRVSLISQVAMKRPKSFSPSCDHTIVRKASFFSTLNNVYCFFLHVLILLLYQSLSLSKLPDEGSPFRCGCYLCCNARGL